MRDQLTQTHPCHTKAISQEARLHERELEKPVPVPKAAAEIIQRKPSGEKVNKLVFDVNWRFWHHNQAQLLCAKDVHGAVAE